MSGPPSQALGAAFAVLAALCFSTAGVLMRHLALDAWEIVFWRCLFAALALTLVIAARNRGRVLPALRGIGPAGLIAGPQLQLSKDGQLPAASTTVVFDGSNWDKRQTVSVRAVNDDYDEDDVHNWPITASMTSTAPGFNDPTLRTFVVDGVAVADSAAFPTRITDNDTSAVLLSHSDGATAVSEAGATDTIGLALQTRPYQDVVVTFCTVTGWRKGLLVQKSDARKIYHQQIGDEMWSAIQITTAAGICAVLDLHAAGRLPRRGLVRQEQVQLDDFLANRFGEYYESRTATRFSSGVVGEEV